MHFLVHHLFVCTFWYIINLCAPSGALSICVHFLVHHQFVCTFWYIISLCAPSGMSSICVHFLVCHPLMCTFWYIINLCAPSGTSSICLVHHQFVCTFWYIINLCAPSGTSSIFVHLLHCVIVIVNLRFLQRPQKRSCGNQLIRRRLSKTKLIGSRSDPESQQAESSQTAMVDGVWS